jgi:phospholipid/cholesterol/gamma-HCH transport system substrate-binding protein
VTIASAGHGRERREYKRPLVGLAAVALAALIVFIAATMFRGGFTDSVAVTVLSPRAGLVMNPGAKVTIRGVQVGNVESIDLSSDHDAVLRLAMDRSQLDLIPSNVTVNIASSTMFGAKAVQLVEPPDPSPKPMYAGQVLDLSHVTVELNTIFEQLSSVLSTIEPAKLNATLAAISAGLNGRGDRLGQTMSDLDSFLATLDPSLPNLQHVLETAPGVLNTYADASHDLVTTVKNTTTISRTVVDQQANLDSLLISVIGLAGTGADVLEANRQPLTDVLHLLVPTTDLANEYHDALNCAIAGLVPYAKNPPQAFPGVVTSVGFTLGRERYRYPSNLPKVAATGGPFCAGQGLPDVPTEMHPPFVVTDIGANPFQYGNQGILLNADSLKQLLFGPIDGPPRNTYQIGMPG